MTFNHPYLSVANDNGSGILNAARLDPGDDWSAAGLLKLVIGSSPARGAHLEVVAVQPIEGAAVKVYNSKAADHHTYVVEVVDGRFTPIPINRSDRCETGGPRLRHILERGAGCCERAALAGVGLEAADDDVAVVRIELDQARGAAGLFRRDQRGA